MNIQKWPQSVTLIRHGESLFNKGKAEKKENPAYVKFVTLFKKEYEELNFAKLAKKEFPSKELYEMAMQMVEDLKAPEYSDYDTPLSDNGQEQAEKTGQALREKMTAAAGLFPNAVYVSPYLRTRQTLEGIQKGFPELKEVKTIEEDRIREQEHGLRTVFPDQYIYLVLNPQQALLKKYSTDYEYRHEGGESLLDVRHRTRGMVDTLIREHGGNGSKPENVMLVTHHLVIMAMRANLERWNREKFINENEHNKPVNCGVSIYRGFAPGSQEAGSSAKGKLIMSVEEYNQKYY